jgi:uncharacterized protein (TIGR02391 family)
MAVFSQPQIEAIADALGHSEEGLTGSQIGQMLALTGIVDTDPSMTKRKRLFNAFAASQAARRDRKYIIAFIRKTMNPARFAREPHRFEPMRANLNRALAFCGLALDESGKLFATEAASTLGEAARRAQELRSDLMTRGIHPDVLRFCREELLADNYFHAVLEAVKSVAEKIRERTGLTDDGAALVDRVFGGSLLTESERSEQKGFANLLKGTFGMFRNTTAHAAKVNWSMSKDDAEDLFSLVSLIHRRIDAASMPSRV